MQVNDARKNKKYTRAHLGWKKMLFMSVFTLGVLLQSFMIARPVFAQGFIGDPFFDPHGFTPAEEINYTAVEPPGGGLPVAVTVDTPGFFRRIMDKIATIAKTIYEKAGRAAVKGMIRVVLTKVAYETAVWIASGDNKQKPLLFTSQWDEYLEDAGDAALGEAFQTLAMKNGYLRFNVCDPFDNRVNLAIQLGLDFATGRPQKPQCTFKEMRERWSEVRDDPAAQKKFLSNFKVSWDIEQNDIGQFLSLQTTFLATQAQKEKSAQLQRQASDPFKDVTGKISQFIETPAQVVAGVQKDAFEKSSNEFLVLVGDPAADALGVFTSTLMSKLLARIKGGVYSFGDLVREDYRNEQGGFVDATAFAPAGGGSGLFNPSGASAPGVAAAEAHYASIADISFSSGDEFQVLADLVACPSEGAQAINCTIDEKFRIAINDRLTVREALDQKLLDGKKPFGFGTQGQPIPNVRDGYSYRSVIVLQRYLIVPVGWKIAAEYIRDFNPGNFTLTDLVSAYDKCGPDNYSPFCGLVDPDWVLKAPANYCRKQGFGNPVAKGEYVDQDGNPATPRKPFIVRQEICVDDQSCIQENPDGTCRAYGYCTEQKRIWRFVGERCEPAYNTCRTLTDTATGQRASLLLNTVNFNDCSRDVAGCQWLCQVFNPLDNDWQCAGNGVVYPTCDAAHDPDGDGNCDGTTGGATCATNPCAIESGRFRCQNTDDEICYLNPESDNPREFNDASISLDRDAPNCDSKNAGCEKFISTRNGTNLINNPSFEYFADNPLDPQPLTFSSEGAGDVLNDNDADVFGFCDGRGGDTHACDDDSDCAGECVGWQSFGGPTVLGVSDPVARGQVAVKFVGTNDAEADTLMYEYESNTELANRSFDLSFRYRKTGGGGACTVKLKYNTDQDSDIATKTLAVNESWTEEKWSTDQLITLPNTRQCYGGNDGSPCTRNSECGGGVCRSDTSLEIRIGVEPAGCELLIDEVKLEEIKPLNFESATATAAYSEYASINTIHLNGQRLSCEPKDLGCEAYTDVKDKSVIPAVITNPVSELCTQGVNKDYSKASCNQCDQGQVGCDFYEEVPLKNQPPDPLAPERTGFYCSNYPNSEARSCTPAYCDNNPSILCDPTADINTLRVVCGHSNPTCVNSAPAQCGDPSATCLPQVSIIPKTGKKCRAQYVGCEEYTNLDIVGQGGEGLEYYNRIKQCVKPVDGDPTQGTYYTWVGSETAGYQLKAFKLKKSNITDHSFCPGNQQICDVNDMINETGTAPCTQLDVGDTANPNADCQDTIQGDPATCIEADLETNPDCGQFYDSGGNIFYRLRSRVISVSEECNPLRSTIDNNVYYAIRSQSKVCPAQMNGCREYKGSAGNNVRILLQENFENTTFEGAGLSNEGAIAGFGDQSMEIRMENNTDPNEGFTDIPQTLLTKGNAYIVSFWARSGTSSETNTLTVSAIFRKKDGSGVLEFGETTLEPTNDWNLYRLGPLVFDREVTDQEVFAIRLNPQDASYPKSLQIDNLKITDSTSQYLIKGSAAICPKFEGCREYSDRQGRTNYLKSFTRLCEQRFLGCEIALDTQNSNLPFAQSFNLNNPEKDPQGKDDVIVPADQATLVVNNPNNFCFATAEGCSALGSPNENKQENKIDGFSTTYRIKDPDNYGTTLCQDHQIMCREYQYGETQYYFKDPGNKACEYRIVGQDFSPSAPSNDIYGWAKFGKDEGCPLFNPYDFPSRPSGSVCAAGDRVGQPCQRDSECPVSFCTSDIADDPTTPNTDESRGWVGACPESADSCTLYLDTYGTNPRDEEILNSSFETDVRNNATGEYTPDNIPDDWHLTACSDGTCTIARETGQIRSGEASLKIEGGVGNPTFTIASEPMRVDSNDIYTLRGYVRKNFNGIFDLGLAFFDRDGNLISENPFIAAKQEALTDLSEKWVAFQGTIGPTQKGPELALVEFPQDTLEVKILIGGTTGSGGIFVDDVSFDHNDEYYYLENSVDTKSCRGNANRDDGCVVLNNVTQSTQNYRADDPRTPFDESKSITRTEGYDPAIASCELNSIDESNTCRWKPNAGVGNQVIKVRPDRDCKEWLACSSAYAVENPDTRAKDYYCFDVGRCRNLSEDGVCNDWVYKPDRYELTEENMTEVNSAPGDTEELEKIQNLTGYVKAGLKAVVPNPQGGSSPARIKGYYTFDAMPQVGISGRNSSRDIVYSGRFENTFCAQGSIGASCTLDQHCRRVDPATGQLTDTEPGACVNPPRGWSKTGGEGNSIQVIDFDETIALPYETAPETIQVDLPNVLKVVPSGEQSNGAQLMLQDDLIQPNGEYVLSFDGRYFTAPTDDDTLRIGFSYNTTCNETSCTRDKVDMFSDVCRGGVRDGLFCDINAGQKRCAGGDNNGDECSAEIDCPNGTCTAKVCINAGGNTGQSCLDVDICRVGLPIEEVGLARCGVPSNCPDGECVQDAFKMTGQMQRYTLGPVMVSNKPTVKELRCSNDINSSCVNDDDCSEDGICIELSTTLLFFEQRAASANTPFLIDNVSLKPVLEVSKIVGLVSRNCRSYPRENALGCDYLDINRITYRGWYGYCLEYDPLNKNQCLVWWPVDVIGGESSLAPRVRAGYSERTPLYMCVASSGTRIRDTKYCVNHDNPEYAGKVCELDNQCGGGRCITMQDTGEYSLFPKDYTFKAAYDNNGKLFCGNTHSQVFACTSSVLTEQQAILEDIVDRKVCVTQTECTTDSECAVQVPETGHITYTKCLDGFCVDTRTCENDGDCPNSSTCEPWYDDTVPEDEIIIPGYCAGNMFRPCNIRNEMSGDATNSDCFLSVGEFGEECIPDFDIPETRVEGKVRVAIPECDEDNLPGDDVTIVDWGPCIPSICDYMGGVCASEPESSAGLPTYGAVCFNDPSLSCGDGVNCPADAGSCVFSTTTRWQCVGGANEGLPCTQHGDCDSNLCSMWLPRFDGVTGRLYNFAAQLEQIPGYADIQHVIFDTFVAGQVQPKDTIIIPVGYVTDPGCNQDNTECGYGGSGPGLGGDNYDIRAVKANGGMVSYGLNPTDNPFNDIPTGILYQPKEGESIDQLPQGGAYGSANPQRDPPDFLVWSQSTQGSNRWRSNGRVVGLWLDSENGKIKNAWALIWNDGSINEIRFKFVLRESCQYFAKVVDFDGKNVAWVQRSKRGSAYHVPEVLFNFYHDFNPFGGMTPATGDDPQTWDSRILTETSPGEVGKQPPFVELPDDYRDPEQGIDDAVGDPPVWQFRAGRPYACVGNCGVGKCDNWVTDISCTTDARCYLEGSHGRCIGAIGICVNAQNQAAEKPTYCNNDQNCRDANLLFPICKTDFRKNGYYYINSRDRSAQELAVAKNAVVDRLRYVFADILEVLRYTQPGTGVDNLGGFVTLPPETLFTQADGFTYYKLMPICSAPRGNTDYCGLRPEVSQIKMNELPEQDNMEIDLGRGGEVSLSFAARVDLEQYPLKHIVIDWDDGADPFVDIWEAAPLTKHTYIHAYKCKGPEDPNYNAYTGGNPDSRCHFNPKIRIVDNWDWCSGNEIANIGPGADIATDLTNCSDLAQDCRNLQNAVDDGSGNNGDNGEWTCNTWDVIGSPGTLGLIHVNP